MTSINAYEGENRKNYEKVGRIYNAITGYTTEVVIKNLLQAEGDINYRISEGSRTVPNLLHARWRVSNDRIFIPLLLDYGADFTRKDNEGRTVVHTIIQEAIDEEELLLKRKFRNEYIDSVLAAHIKFNNSSNPSDNNGISHFHGACMINNAAAVEFFLKNGVDVNQPVNANSPIFPLDTPLHLAVKYTCPEVVEILLKYGANIHLKNAAQLSSLHLIVKRSIAKYEVTTEPQCKRILNAFVKFMINNDTNTIDDFGLCKLHVACLLQDQSMVESVLEQIPNINHAVNFDSPICAGYTALHFAAFSEIQIFQLLLDNGANIEAKNARGATPFDLCLQNYAFEDIHSILSSKTEWKDIVLSDNETKLIDVVSAMENADEFILFLNSTSSALALFVPFDSSLWPGYTVLHLAVVFAKKIFAGEVYFLQQRDDTTIIAECLRQGADMMVGDAKGSTALHVAFYMEKRCIVHYLLEQHDQIINPVDQDNLSHFHIACALGHFRVVKLLSSTGINLNSPVLSTFKWHVPFENRHERYYPYRHFFICPGSTALHISVASDNYAITTRLLKCGADVHVQDVNGFTPVHRLLACGNPLSCKPVENLLFKVKNLKNITTNCGLSHLHVACYFYNCNAIKKLLKLGADINAPLRYKCDRSVKDYDEYFCDQYGNFHNPLSFLSEYAGNTPLHFSYHEVSTWETTIMLMKRDADVFVKNDKGISTIQNLLKIVGSYMGKYFPYNELIKNIGIQQYLDKEFGITQLHLACIIDDPNLVEKLIDRGANVNAKVYSNSPVWQGHTPLHSAVKRVLECYNECSNGFDKIIRLLIKHGADPLLVDDNNDTPLHLIKHFYGRHGKFLNFTSVISVLFDNLTNFNVNPTNNQGLSLFHVACIAGNPYVIEKYLKHGVDVNQAVSYFSNDCPGSSPLHLLIEFSEYTDYGLRQSSSSIENVSHIVDMLLDNGANINATDAYGNTPLHKICRLGVSPEFFIEKFIRNGADIHAANVNGDNPLAMCIYISNVDWELIEIFLKNGADINMYNSISQQGYLNRYFIDKIIETRRVFNTNSMGRTILHNVASCTSDSCNDMMIQRITAQGCDIDHEDNEGKTALHLAVSFKNDETILGLLKNGADINITDKYGKTAFAYCDEAKLPNEHNTWNEDIDYNRDPNYAIKLFAMHVCKLEFCGQYVSKQNKQLQVKVLKDLAFGNNAFDRFYAEIEKTKSIKIGNTSLSLYGFLMNTDTNIVYKNMTNEERQEVDQFFEMIDDHEFSQINGLLKLKCRQSIGRIMFIEPALTSLNVLIESQLPDLCCRIILKFSKNEDLKSLIAAVT